MSMKDRLAAKAAGIGTTPRTSPAPETVAARPPKTAPGQLMSSLPFLAEKEREIEELRGKLREAEKSAPQLELPVAELHEVEGRRRRLTPEQYSELRDNLRTNPLVQAVTVRRRAGGGYEIISGHNRVAIYRELGRERILAIVLQDADDYVTEASALYANLFQSDLSDYEKYLGFKRLLLLTGKTQKEVAADSGADEKSVSRWLSFGDLPTEALALIESAPDKLGGTAAMALAALAKDGKTASVVEAVKAIVDGQVTQEIGVRLAKTGKTPPATTVRPEPVTIRSGKSVYCKMLGNKQTLRLDFRTEEERMAVESAIRDVLDRFAKNP
ncbi:MAG TPA: ParB N-terminal domain-containing protein [Noviherbaspirillum sp.]|nr:ParB N-terminal domain-containing protein [Noviherbaspirillum sp.]